MATKPLGFDSHRLKYGQIGESKIATWLRRTRGSYVLPAYEKEIDNNKGPRLFCPTGELVVPDMLAINGQKVSWIEAKHKSVFSWHRITKRWVTGINIRHYNDYLEVAKVTPWPIWLLFLHEKDRELSRDEPWPCPTGLFGQQLEILNQRINHTSDKWGNSGMVYWAYDNLKKLASLEEINQVYFG